MDHNNYPIVNALSLMASPAVLSSCPSSWSDFCKRHFTSIVPSLLGFAAGIIIYDSIKELKRSVDRILGISSKKPIENLKIILMGLMGGLILSLSVKLIEFIVKIIIEWKRFKNQNGYFPNQSSVTNTTINTSEVIEEKFEIVGYICFPCIKYDNGIISYEGQFSEPSTTKGFKSTIFKGYNSKGDIILFTIKGENRYRLNYIEGDLKDEDRIIFKEAEDIISEAIYPQQQKISNESTSLTISTIPKSKFKIILKQAALKTFHPCYLEKSIN